MCRGGNRLDMVARKIVPVHVHRRSIERYWSASPLYRTDNAASDCCGDCVLWLLGLRPGDDRL
jgi:hypothetical protein